MIPNLGVVEILSFLITEKPCKIAILRGGRPLPPPAGFWRLYGPAGHREGPVPLDLGSLRALILDATVRRDREPTSPPRRRFPAASSGARSGAGHWRRSTVQSTRADAPVHPAADPGAVDHAPPNLATRRRRPGQLEVHRHTGIRLSGHVSPALRRAHDTPDLPGGSRPHIRDDLTQGFCVTTFSGRQSVLNLVGSPGCT